jgi:hypothetical protein
MARTGSAPKSTRKSRKPRVRTSISSEWLEYTPTDDDWTEMEIAIGRPINSDVRSETIRIVQQYFRAQPFETNAPFLEEVLAGLDAIARAAGQLQKALAAESSVIDIIRAQIDQDLPSKLDVFDEMLQSIISAAPLAKTEFVEQSRNGFAEGEAWQEMANKMKALMRSHSMPYGASQDGTKAKDPTKGSPFVQFIISLQKSFPSNLRRHYGISPFALAKEINRTGRVPRKMGH